MRKVSCLLLICAALLGCAEGRTAVIRTARAGVLDLRDAKFTESIYRLDGQWELYWRQVPDSIDRLDRTAPTEYFALPYIWNGNRLPDGTVAGGDGFASFRLRLLLPADAPPLAVRIKEQATAYRLFADGRLLGGAGRVGTTPESSRPDTRPSLFFLSRPSDGELELVLQVSNFHHRNGGIWHGLYLGDHAGILDYVRSIRLRDAFLAGVIFIIGIYHAGLFAMRRNDRLSFVFAWFCLSIFLRHMSTGEKLLLETIPLLGYEVYIRIEYLTLFFMPVMGLHFVNVLYAGFLHRRILTVLYLAAAVLSAIVLLTPVRIFSWTTPFWQPVILLMLLLSLYILVRAYLRRMENVRLFALGVLAVVLTAINDMAYTNQWIRSGFLLHFGLFALILCVSIVISIRFSRAFRDVERLSERLEKTNLAYARFVPTAFLDHLNKPSITHIRLGDQVEREMTLLFSDIRGFTRISESMSPEENFNFLNSYLKRVSPVVRKYGGFIDKYIGDAVMALFPGSPEAALEAAIEMQAQVREFNHRRIRKDYEPIQVGMGLHFGRLILGTVGDEDRMDGTVISDDVNTAARIESLTKEYGAYILISSDLVMRLPDPGRFRMRRIDTVQVRGKTRPVSVFEVYDGLAEFILDRFEATRKEFERGLSAFENGDRNECIERMQRVLRLNPADRAAQLYLERSRTAPSQ